MTMSSAISAESNHCSQAVQTDTGILFHEECTEL